MCECVSVCDPSHSATSPLPPNRRALTTCIDCVPGRSSLSLRVLGISSAGTNIQYRLGARFTGRSCSHGATRSVSQRRMSHTSRPRWPGLGLLSLHLGSQAAIVSSARIAHSGTARSSYLTDSPR